MTCLIVLMVQLIDQEIHPVESNNFLSRLIRRYTLLNDNLFPR